VKPERLAQFRPHRLHQPERHWPETNCYVDLWIEVLADRGLTPEAMLGFTVRQDFEGDQFTFFKVPLEDLEVLYGISVQELAVFDDLEEHLVEQISRGRLPLVEVDGLYLPDTDGVTYRISHSKTTIAPTLVDMADRRMEYFHNAGFFELHGEDYDGIFRALPHLKAQPDILWPYTEFAKFRPAPAADALPQVALKLLIRHMKFRPADNPVAAFQAAFPAHADRLAQRPPEFFHTYAFNTLRQLGANFELLASHLEWLGRVQDIDFVEEIDAAQAIAGGAKAFQFQLARAMARGRLAGLEAQLTPMVEAYGAVFADLSGKIGS
jgi:hypothetical protein